MPASRKRSAPVRVSPLQIDLARRIARQVVEGELQPGAHLAEETLAAQFEVSRTPVRAALRLLAERGLIAYRANSGYFVEAKAEGMEVPDFGESGMGGDELYRQLVDGRARKLLPDTLTEIDLLRTYPVSRSLLTKTLMRMMADGLVEKRAGHGWRFLPSLETPEALAESYRFRMIVECAGLLEPTFAVDPVQMDRCRKAYEQVIEQGYTNLSPGEFFSLNTSFHEMLARFSGNRFILQAVQQQTQLRRLEEHAAFYRQINLIEACQEHLQIIDALALGDREWASALMRRHLVTARDLS
ncbi:MAG: GntR family transcriptional regulator [Cupriavidus basilensis]|nr:GntR family transcriptional regulator [Cupriavidus basilensis]